MKRVLPREMMLVNKSKEERRFLEMLESFGLKQGDDFIYQHEFVIDNNQYFVDFAFPKVNLVVEMDGKHDVKRYKTMPDRKKDSLLMMEGWEVFRIKYDNFNKEPAFWVRVVIELINN